MILFPQLEPIFLRMQSEKLWSIASDIRTADGVQFHCPKCFYEEGRTLIGVHQVLCWAPHVPQSIRPTPGRWNIVGKGPIDLSLVAASSSVLLLGGCNAHFHVTKGKVTNCDQPEW